MQQTVKIRKLSNSRGRPNVRKNEILLLIFSGFNTYRKIKDYREARIEKFYASNVNIQIEQLKKEGWISDDKFTRKYNKKEFTPNWDKMLSLFYHSVEYKFNRISDDYKKLREHINRLNKIRDNESSQTFLEDFKENLDEYDKYIDGCRDEWKRYNKTSNKNNGIVKRFLANHFLDAILLKDYDIDKGAVVIPQIEVFLDVIMELLSNTSTGKVKLMDAWYDDEEFMILFGKIIPQELRGKITNKHKLR